jgi:predicted  nucleic acid-binding Zn-ribbon protein
MNEPTPIDLTWLWATLSAAGSSLVTWLFSRKKQEAETKASELDNVEKAVEIWRKMAEDLKAEIRENREENTKLRQQMEQQEVEIKSLRRTLDTMKAQFEAEIQSVRRNCTDLSCKNFSQ